MTKTTDSKPRTATNAKSTWYLSRTFTIVAAILIATAAWAIPIDTTAQTTVDSTRVHLTTGIRINQGKPFGILGATLRLSGRIYQYFGADLGGDEYSGTTQTAIRLTPVQTFTLFALLGPQVEHIETEPNEQLTIDYLTGATGLILDYHRNNNLTAFAAIAYLWSNSNIRKWKFGIGVTLPLSLK